MKGSRIIYINVVSGIMISWMILVHCVFFSHQSVPFLHFFGFFMPWFFYKSGMFFFPIESKAQLKKDANKLLRFFLVYSFIGWIIWSVLGLIDGSLGWRGCLYKPVSDFIHHGSISANGALWFLLSLFFVRQLCNVLIKKIPSPILAVICFVIAVTLNAIGWQNHSWWFGNVFSGMCFFLWGYWLNDKESNRVIFFLSALFYTFVIIACFMEWISDFPYLYMHANKMHKGNYLLFFPTALAGIIIINNLFRILCKYIKFRVLEYIGKNSMTFYTTHWILLVIITFGANYFFNLNESHIIFLVLLVASVMLLPLISEFIKSLKIQRKSQLNTYNKWQKHLCSLVRELSL